MSNIVFLIFASISLFAAAMVILVKNPVKAVLSLILCFISAAAVWLTLDAEFLAWTLILVYVGAVLVLFLFVVMMLDIRFATLRSKFSRWSPVGLGVAAALVAFIFVAIERDGLVINKHIAQLAYGKDDVSNSKLLGEYIFTNYLVQFEIAGIILLAAIIAAIGLIYRGPRNRSVENVHKQVTTNPKDRVRLVDGN